MTTLARILATLTTILGVPLIWHAIMPTSSHWMNGSQIAGSLPLFLISAIGYTRLYLYLTNRQLLCIGWTISAATAIITYQSLL